MVCLATGCVSRHRDRRYVRISDICRWPWQMEPYALWLAQPRPRRDDIMSRSCGEKRSHLKRRHRIIAAIPVPATTSPPMATHQKQSISFDWMLGRAQGWRRHGELGKLPIAGNPLHPRDRPNHPQLHEPRQQKPAPHETLMLSLLIGANVRILHDLSSGLSPTCREFLPSVQLRGSITRWDPSQ